MMLVTLREAEKLLNRDHKRLQELVNNHGIKPRGKVVRKTKLAFLYELDDLKAYTNRPYRHHCEIPAPPGYIALKEAAIVAGVSTSTITEMARTGKIECVKVPFGSVGKRVFVSRTALLLWAASRSKPSESKDEVLTDNPLLAANDSVCLAARRARLETMMRRSK